MSMRTGTKLGFYSLYLPDSSGNYTFIGKFRSSNVNFRKNVLSLLFSSYRCVSDISSLRIYDLKTGLLVDFYDSAFDLVPVGVPVIKFDKEFFLTNKLYNEIRSFSE